MVGEEGPTLEARDFNKIVTVISEYVSANKPTYDQVKASNILVFGRYAGLGDQADAPQAAHLCWFALLAS